MTVELKAGQCVGLFADLQEGRSSHMNRGTHIFTRQGLRCLAKSFRLFAANLSDTRPNTW